MPIYDQMPSSVQSATGQPGAAPAQATTIAPSGGASPIYSDPAFLAFMRSSGLSNEIAAADVASKTGATNMALDIATGDVNRAGEKSRRNIAGAHEARGVYRSGAQLRAQGEQEADQASRLSALRLSAHTTIGNLQTDLMQRIATNQQRAAELGLSTAQNMDQQSLLAKKGLL